MKKVLKKVAAFSTVLLCVTQLKTFTLTVQASNLGLYQSAAEQLIDQMDSDKVIEGEIPLYNTKNNESAVLFDLNDGYIIVDEATNEISEFCLSEDHKFINNNDEHYVYGGPQNIYIEKNDKLENVATKDEKENKDDIEDNINTFRKKVQAKKINKSLSGARTASVSKRYGMMLVGKMPNFSYNPNGICGSCASANLLTYLAWNVSSKYVPSQYGTAGDGKELINSIVPYVENGGYAALNTNNKGGSNHNQLQAGLNKYIADNIEYKDYAYSADLNANPHLAIELTNKGLPFILGLHRVPDESNEYGNHWVVNNGYVYADGAPDEALYYRVIDGWGKSDATVSCAWTDYIVYIDM